MNRKLSLGEVLRLYEVNPRALRQMHDAGKIHTDDAGKYDMAELDGHLDRRLAGDVLDVEPSRPLGVLHGTKERTDEEV